MSAFTRFITDLANAVTGILPTANGGWGTAGGAWPTTAPAVTGTGTPGTFAATCAISYLQVGKTVFLQGVVTVTNVGTATSFQTTFPVAPLQLTSMLVFQGNSAIAAHLHLNAGGTGVGFYNSATGAILAPAVQTYDFSGIYQAQ